MFGRKKDEEDDVANLGIPEGDSPPPAKLAAMPAPRVRPGPFMGRPEVVRRAADFANPRRAPEQGYGDSKRLLVGRDIVLAGAINACDKLVVEGRVEANLADCREMEVTETGTFKGQAEIDVAEINGRFEGTLVARELLLVRSKGSIVGTVRYGRLEIERGGEIEGEVSVYTPQLRAEPARPQPEAQPVAETAAE
jgi:cytoskeletal protein CcmA (bactofilin family)